MLILFHLHNNPPPPPPPDKVAPDVLSFVQLFLLQKTSIIVWHEEELSSQLVGTERCLLEVRRFHVLKDVMKEARKTKFTPKMRSKVNSCCACDGGNTLIMENILGFIF